MSNSEIQLTTQLLNQQDPLVTPTQTAETLNVTTGTLQVWRSTGRYDLPYVKIGKKVMYRLSAINRFIESRSMEHTGCSSYEKGGSL